MPHWLAVLAYSCVANFSTFIFFSHSYFTKHATPTGSLFNDGGDDGDDTGKGGRKGVVEM